MRQQFTVNLTNNNSVSKAKKGKQSNSSEDKYNKSRTKDVNKQFLKQIFAIVEGKIPITSHEIIFCLSSSVGANHQHAFQILNTAQHNRRDIWISY